MNHLINNTFFRLQWTKKKGKHVEYSVQIHRGKYSVWYIKKLWKSHCEFAEFKVN